MAITVDPRITIHPIDVERYERMIDGGVFDETDRVELLKGVLSEMSPQGDEHARVIEWLTEELTVHARSGGYSVRVQLPLRLPPASMPEPDLAVVARRAGRPAHPEHAWLGIEVSVTSQAIDLGVKAELYAAAGIDELWVVDVPTRTVHVHRSARGGVYQDVTRVAEGELRCRAAAVPSVDVDVLFGVLG